MLDVFARCIQLQRCCVGGIWGSVIAQARGLTGFMKFFPLGFDACAQKPCSGETCEWGGGVFRVYSHKSDSEEPGSNCEPCRATDKVKASARLVVSSQ